MGVLPKAFIMKAIYNIYQLRMEHFLNRSQNIHDPPPQQPQRGSLNRSVTSLPSETPRIPSLLSPMTIIKFIGKNMEEMASPVFSSLMVNLTNTEPRTKSPFSAEEIGMQFARYVESIGQHMLKYKANCLKHAVICETNNIREMEREQLENQAKISKIPEQYFAPSQHFNDNQPTDNDPPDNPPPLSTKLQSLLQLDESPSSRRRSKEKRGPLSKKQETLEEYLDQIELIIYNKTRKYPDKYLHYLANLNNSDLELGSLLAKITQTRSTLDVRRTMVRERYRRVVELQRKKLRITGLLTLMQIMRTVHKFKNEPERLSANQNSKQKLKCTEVISLIRRDPNLPTLHRLPSIALTLGNIEELGRSIRAKKLQQLSKLLLRNLGEFLNSTYSREAWLKNELPKDALMVDRMSADVQATLHISEDHNVNSSYMNISVLDQSYCVGSRSGSARNEVSMLGVGKELKDIIETWEDYSQEYIAGGCKLEEENELIFEILQRSLLKFSNVFDKDLEDYVAFIYAQRGLSPKLIPSHKERLSFIQPKFFNKIAKVYFQALSTTLSFAQTFRHLEATYLRLVRVIEEKVMEVVAMRNITDYALVENRVLSSEDAAQLLSVLDYWFEYATEVSDKIQMLQQQNEMSYIDNSMMQFQQNLHKHKQKTISEFLTNFHRFSLVSDLKSAVQRQDFVSISIPVNCFSILDMIINWGQTPQNTQGCPQTATSPEIEESFNFGVLVLQDLEAEHHGQPPRRPSHFSIFKVIDKRLIIEGKGYRICQSLVLLACYLATYLKAKTDFPLSAVATDERICELIGFYIWFGKKMVFSVGNCDKNDGHAVNSTHNIGSVALAKGLGGVKKAINGVYKQISSTSKASSESPTEKRTPPDQPPMPPRPPPPPPKKTIPSLSMIANLCDLLLKFIDILNITSKQKKIEKTILDLKNIKVDCEKEIAMVAYLDIQKQISCLYESKLKSRKQLPTQETLRIIEIIEKARHTLAEYYAPNDLKKLLENAMKIVSKNYFGYLFNVDARGKAELKWFVPKLKETVGDLFQDEVLHLEKQLRA